MKNIYLLLLSVLLWSCQGNTEPEIEYIEPINEPVIVSEIDVPKPTNLYTPELWERANIDQNTLYFFSRDEELTQDQEANIKIVREFAEANGINYHGYYTNDDLGLVALNDSLFFNLSIYLKTDPNGLVCLKKNEVKYIPLQIKKGIVDERLKVFFGK